MAAAAPFAVFAGRYHRPAAAAQHPDIIDEAEAFRSGWSQGLSLDEGVLRAGPAGGSYIAPARYVASSVTHAGIHWSGSEGLSLQFRVGTSSWTWAPWKTVHLESSPRTPAEDWFGALVSIEGRRLIQYRVEFLAGAALRRVTISGISSPPRTSAGPLQRAQDGEPGHLVAPDVTGDPGTQLVGAPGQAIGPASGATLQVVPREAWGADESLRFTPEGSERWHEMFVPVRQLVVHHTVSRTSYGPAEAAADVQAIYLYHATVHGWGDIGYNVLIDRWGDIYEGRHSRGGDPGDAIAGRSLINADVSGGHTKWHNYGSAGVALLGDSEDPNWPMYGEGPMWDSLVAYTAFVCREGNLRPIAADGEGPALHDFLRSDNAWHFDSATIDGHYASEATLCPGERVIGQLPALRQAVFEQLADTSRSGIVLTAILPEEHEVTVGTPLSATWAPEAPEAGWTLVSYEYRWEAWFKPEDQDDITYLNGFSNDSQPLARWLPAPLGLTYASIVPWAPGQYTLQVRPIVRRGSETRPAAFKAARTWLVAP